MLPIKFREQLEENQIPCIVLRSMQHHPSIFEVVLRVRNLRNNSDVVAIGSVKLKTSAPFHDSRSEERSSEQAITLVLLALFMCIQTIVMIIILQVVFLQLFLSE